MSEGTELQRWLLLIYRVPQEPASRRTYVWRQLKQLGAHYLQQAAAILPDRDGMRSNLETLSQKIREYGGEVSLLSTVSPDEGWEGELMARFNQARDAEYTEVVENVERLEDEIKRERRKGRFTFAQLEDIEGEWEKLQRWYERVHARNFFDAPGRADAAAALACGQAALEAFTAEVSAREGVEAEVEGP
jgi:hypothetical protein